MVDTLRVKLEVGFLDTMKKLKQVVKLFPGNPAESDIKDVHQTDVVNKTP
jgi:hypothetical protein